MWHTDIFYAEFNRFEFIVLYLLTKAKERSLPHNLPIARERIIGLILFPRVVCELYLVSSRDRTRVVMSISYKNSHYTMGTSHCKLFVFDRSTLTYNRVQNTLKLHKNVDVDVQ